MGVVKFKREIPTLRRCPEINYARTAHVYPTLERSSLENARDTTVYLPIFSLRTCNFRANLSGTCIVYFWTAPKEQRSGRRAHRKSRCEHR
jgi:hypothetical protein